MKRLPRFVAMHSAFRGMYSIPTSCTHLTDHEQMLVKSVQDFAQSAIDPHVESMDAAQKMRPEIIQGLFEQGLMGIEIPPEYGGSGMSFFDSILAIEEISRVDASVGILVDIHNTLLNAAVKNHGSEALKAKYLPKLSQSTIGVFCITEPSSGSDAFTLKTKATKVDGGYQISGSKIFISNSAEAGLFLVFANADFSKGYKGIMCFLLDKSEHPGIVIGRKEDKLGIRASSTHEVQFKDVFVPEENIVGSPDKGYKIAIELLNEGRIGIGAQMLGIAQGALDVSLPYVYERKQFGKVIGDFQGMQFQIAEQMMQVHTARLHVYNAARKQQNGEPFLEDSAMAKLIASRVAEATASKAIEWMGGIGFMQTCRLGKMYRDAKIGAIYEGTSNIQLQTLAKSIKSRMGY